jgi:hypothetical protein
MKTIRTFGFKKQLDNMPTCHALVLLCNKAYVQAFASASLSHSCEHFSQFIPKNTHMVFTCVMPIFLTETAFNRSVSHVKFRCHSRQLVYAFLAILFTLAPVKAF